jgi:cytochrome c1
LLPPHGWATVFIKLNSLKDVGGMKRSVAAVAVALTVGLVGCDERSEAAPETSLPPPADAPAEVAPVAAPASAATDVAAAPADAAPIAGAPAFAALYPGAQADGPATVANGPTGPGGLITFTTDAGPDAVVAFYRQRAEAAGLAPVMAMNQGEARAYGAAARKDNGASLQVVASPGEGGRTSVQLTWSAGA